MVHNLTCEMICFTLAAQGLLTVPPCAAEFKRDVLNGATTICIKNLQKGLRELKSPALVVDGKFGKATESAVKSFQKTEGLKGE